MGAVSWHCREFTEQDVGEGVLSDKQGQYQHFANLPAATYALRIRAIGYNSDPRTSVQLTATETLLLISLCETERCAGAI